MFMYLQLFVIELQQNKNTTTWEIEWIHNNGKITTSNTHKNYLLINKLLSCRHFFFFDNGRQTYG